jgi:hypothetical protein
MSRRCRHISETVHPKLRILTTPVAARFARKLALLFLIAALAHVVSGSPADASRRPPVRTVEFSGYTWQVKSSRALVGPGPNYFSDSAANVWADGLGRLHLKLKHSKGRWYSAEVINTQSLGRGRYSFELGSPVHALDPNVVLGLFTWSDDPAYNNREVDVEFSRWGNAADPTNGQYVVQPYDHSGNLQRITQPAASSSTHSFDWQEDAVTFTSSTASPSAWTHAGADVPEPGSEHVRMNLWLFRGAPPENGASVEIVVERFTFTPAQ